MFVVVTWVPRLDELLVKSTWKPPASPRLNGKKKGEVDGSKPGGKKRKNDKQEGEPSPPKKPISAFFYYSMSQRPTVSTLHLRVRD